ncbi:MAG: hypothetical protein LBU75_12715 [Desulfovibrio sp.]|jgi:hypothetical protein|nr:hypothetical protein [Desulfovibrio sp.]
MGGTLARSLSLRTSLLVTVIAVSVFAVIIGTGAWRQRHAALEELEAVVSRESGMIKTAIDRPMLLGNDAGTRAEFAELASHYADTTVHLASFNGNITYSTRPEAERRDLAEVLTDPGLGGPAPRGTAAPWPMCSPPRACATARVAPDARHWKRRCCSSGTGGRCSRMSSASATNPRATIAMARRSRCWGSWW